MATPQTETTAVPARQGPFPWRTVAAVAAGGILGALGRYAVASALPAPNDRFPWATFLVNVTGAAALGFVLILVTEKLPSDHSARPFACTGIIGAYTTFSTYVVDADLLVRAHHDALAVTYVLASAVAGLAAVWLGVTTARAALHSLIPEAGELDDLSHDPEVR